MYLPAHFEQPRTEALHALMDAYPFATLVAGGGAEPDADHLPLLLDRSRGAHGVLMGHVARANPLWRRAGDGIPALAVFAGPDAYVSPSLYPSKAATGKVVPTWNYAVVHAHGILRAIDDRGWLEAFVTRLTERFEAGRPAPWAVSDAPAAFVEAMLGAIVGIEIDVARLTGKFKLGQNREAGDRAALEAAFAGGATERERALGALMQAARPAGREDVP